MNCKKTVTLQSLSVSKRQLKLQATCAFPSMRYVHRSQYMLYFQGMGVTKISNSESDLQCCFLVLMPFDRPYTIFKKIGKTIQDMENGLFWGVIMGH